MAEEPSAQIAQGIIKALETVAASLELPTDFLLALLFRDDDWSFVVKGHALLETALCMLLASHLRSPQLEEVLADRVEMSARIHMLSALELFTLESLHVVEIR